MLTKRQLAISIANFVKLAGEIRGVAKSVDDEDTDIVVSKKNLLNISSQIETLIGGLLGLIGDEKIEAED